jgi:alcohol dehydrogenase (cytochrome c)
LPDKAYAVASGEINQGARAIDRKSEMAGAERHPAFSGVLSTAGGVVFSCRLTGEFETFDADSGVELWQFQTGSGIERQPVMWQQDGVQYIAITSGIGDAYSIPSDDEQLAKVPPGVALQW